MYIYVCVCRSLSEWGQIKKESAAAELILCITGSLGFNQLYKTVNEEIFLLSDLVTLSTLGLCQLTLLVQSL